MPFSSYSELQTAVTNWLARPDIASYVPDFIRLAEQDLERKVEATFQDATSSGTLDGTGALSLPADCLYVRRFSVDADTPADFQLVSPDQLNNLRDSLTGDTPAYAYRRGNSLIHAPTSEDDYSLDYVKVISKLSAGSSGDTTDYLTHYFDALLYGSLIHSAPFLKADARLPMWASMYAGVVEGIRLLEFRKRTGGMVLRMRPASFA